VTEAVACRTLDITDAYPEGFRCVREPKEGKRPVCPITNGVQAWRYMKRFGEHCWDFRLNSGRLERQTCKKVDGLWVDEWVPCTVAQFVKEMRWVWKNEENPPLFNPLWWI